jgi:hypothetical protein
MTRRALHRAVRSKKFYQEVSSVLAEPRPGQNLSAQLGQSKGVIEFTIREQTGVG